MIEVQMKHYYFTIYIDMNIVNFASNLPLHKKVIKSYYVAVDQFNVYKRLKQNHHRLPPFPLPVPNPVAPFLFFLQQIPSLCCSFSEGTA